jgi:hypothetical protein
MRKLKVKYPSGFERPPYDPFIMGECCWACAMYKRSLKVCYFGMKVEDPNDIPDDCIIGDDWWRFQVMFKEDKRK